VVLCSGPCVQKFCSILPQCLARLLAWEIWQFPSACFVMGGKRYREVQVSVLVYLLEEAVLTLCI
jgi:hypothetical protein